MNDYSKTWVSLQKPKVYFPDYLATPKKSEIVGAIVIGLIIGFGLFVGCVAAHNMNVAENKKYEQLQNNYQGQVNVQTTVQGNEIQ